MVAGEQWERDVRPDGALRETVVTSRLPAVCAAARVCMSHGSCRQRLHADDHRTAPTARGPHLPVSRQSCHQRPLPDCRRTAHDSRQSASAELGLRKVIISRCIFIKQNTYSGTKEP